MDYFAFKYVSIILCLYIRVSFCLDAECKTLLGTFLTRCREIADRVMVVQTKNSGHQWNVNESGDGGGARVSCPQSFLTTVVVHPVATFFACWNLSLSCAGISLQPP
eukprot:1195114-Prorocentrum_minimum.AAC.2